MRSCIGVVIDAAKEVAKEQVNQKPAATKEMFFSAVQAKTGDDYAYALTRPLSEWLKEVTMQDLLDFANIED